MQTGVDACADEPGFSCGASRSRGVFCWGRSNFTPGDGETEVSPIPVQVTRFPRDHARRGSYSKSISSTSNTSIPAGAPGRGLSP